MDDYRINIAIIEPSDIIYEGLSVLLHKTTKHLYLFRIDSLEELSNAILNESINIVILNPIVLQNRLKYFAKIQKQYANIVWFSLIYAYFENELLAKFHDTISISDSTEILTQKINKSFNHNNCGDTSQDQLSEREIDVLALLIKGLLNKEIAEELNISIHTVISHRKNITKKTGIKSLPGLTIYAISKKIIPIDSANL